MRRLYVLVGITIGITVAAVATAAWAARNAAGTYSLPSGNPVVSGTTISSTWANATLSDLSSEITDSLDRSGKGGMLAPLKLTNGTVSAPSLAFTNSAGSGFYRLGSNDIGMAIGGVLSQEWIGAGTATAGYGVLDSLGAGDGTLAYGLRFGSSSSGEGIASKRTATGNQFGLDLFTNSVSRISIANGGAITLGGTTNVTSSFSVGSTLFTVGGITGNTHVGGTLDVTSTISAAGAAFSVDGSGDATMAHITAAAGKFTVDGNGAVSAANGSATISSAGALVASGASIGGTTAVAALTASGTAGVAALTVSGDSALTGNMTVAGSHTKTSCTLNGASGPSTCTATVTSGCAPVCSTESAATTVGCSVSGTTVTARGQDTGSSSSTSFVHILCL